ncbi:hypothetical protein N9Y53_03545 [Candidatus Pelagibacter bacterium]|nr:hypothetical protein [Candidatus Pelagibacter bacterium]
MIKRLIYLILPFFFSILCQVNANAGECDEGSWNQILLDNKDYHYDFPFLEERNDIGIFFDYEWNSKLKKIIIRRNDNNYPIIRFSLFDKKNLRKGSIIKKIGGLDLAYQSDKDLKTFFLFKNLDNSQSTVVEVELITGKKLFLEIRPYKLTNFKLTNFELNSIQSIDSTKGAIEVTFQTYIENNRPDLLATLRKNNFDEQEINTEALCDPVKEWINLPIKAVELNEYKYDEDVRKGLKNKTKLEDSVIEFTYDKGKFRVLRTESGVGHFRQSFDFKKFPFDKQKLIINITSGIRSSADKELIKYATDTAAVAFITPEDGAFIGINKFKNNNYLREWKVSSVDIKNKEIVDENYYDKDLKKIVTHSENSLNLEINVERNYIHYVYKIMVPVFLILCVAWFVLWIPTKYFEARLATSMVALLSLIAYNFVFANDIPKLEYLTALDKFILLSYIFCCIPTFMSIWFSRLYKIKQAKIAKVNSKIRIYGGFVYLILTMQIFYI